MSDLELNLEVNEKGIDGVTSKFSRLSTSLMTMRSRYNGVNRTISEVASKLTNLQSVASAGVNVATQMARNENPEGNMVDIMTDTVIGYTDMMARNVMMTLAKRIVPIPVIGDMVGALVYEWGKQAIKTTYNDVMVAIGRRNAVTLTKEDAEQAIYTDGRSLERQRRFIRENVVYDQQAEQMRRMESQVNDYQNELFNKALQENQEGTRQGFQPVIIGGQDLEVRIEAIERSLRQRSRR